jgi:hypothetical protein
MMEMSRDIKLLLPIGELAIPKLPVKKDPKPITDHVNAWGPSFVGKFDPEFAVIDRVDPRLFDDATAPDSDNTTDQTGAAGKKSNLEMPRWSPMYIGLALGILLVGAVWIRRSGYIRDFA